MNVSNPVLYGVQGTVVGWGLLENDDRPRKLRVGLVTIITNEDCSAIMSRLARKNHNIDERRLCSVANPYILVRRVSFGLLHFIILRVKNLHGDGYINQYFLLA
jgi:hypothetical protein